MTDPTPKIKAEVAAMDLHAAVRRLLKILETTEEKPEGHVFRPTTIGTCRVMHGIWLEHLMPRLKELSEEVA